MNILAIDTATEYLSLALQVNSKRSYILEEVGNKQAEVILAKIQQLLLKHNISVKALDLILYNEGPGSFTGLRIGLSVAKGIAFGFDIPLMPIPAFAIFAHATKAMVNSSQVLVGLDARLKQVYLALVDTVTLDYLLEPQIINPEAISVDIDIPLIGSGFSTYKNLLPASLQQANLLVLASGYPNALNMLEIVELNKYQKVDAAVASLVYLRNKVALDLQEQQATKNTYNCNLD